MSTQPVEDLQLRALEQRKKIHQTVSELKHKVSETRERFDVKRIVREHFVGVTVAAAAISLVLGYAVIHMFNKR